MTESPRATACAHCLLPVPAGLIDVDSSLQFCCNGCSAAYSVIHSCGLDNYYRLRANTGVSPTQVAARVKAYAEYDDPAFHTRYVRPGAGALLRTGLALQGVHCAACVWLLEKLGTVVDGVIEARLDFRRATLNVVWDPSVVKLSSIARTLDTLGYAPHPEQNVTPRELRRVDDHRALARIAVAGAAAGNVMLLAFALYAGAFSGMQADFETYFRWLSLAIGLVSLLWPGRVFFQNALASIRTRTPHLDLPISIGLLAGGISGAINTIRGSGEIYFDSLTVLIFLLLVGRWIGQRQQRHAADAVELLFSLTPTSARLIENDRVREVALEAIGPGDLVEVRAGDSVPADGIIESGESRVDLALLTGESRPSPVQPGDVVAAGTTNLVAPLRVRVVTTGEATRVGRLMRMLADSAARRGPIVRFADRLSSAFVGGMLGLSLLTFAIWLKIDPSRALANATSLLIVTCPCALGLATPLAISTAIGRAAKRGILIKGGDTLEQLTRPGTIFLDKTGTITQGRTTIVRWAGDSDAKRLAAAVEACVSHPIARAFVESLPGELPRATEIHQTLGAGVRGVVEGKHVAVGSSGFIHARGIDTPPWAEHEIRAALERAHSPILVVVDHEVAAVASIGDPIRPDARLAIDGLRRQGWRVGILSGDRVEVVTAVGHELGLPAEDCVGEASPEGKLAIVSSAASDLSRLGAIVMVGDGVNDSAALAAADAGIAVHGGAEASLATADIYLSRPGLASLIELNTGSRATMRAIKRCLAASLCYNLFAAALAMTGYISPMLAALLMPASSITVLVLSARVNTFGDR